MSRAAAPQCMKLRHAAVGCLSVLAVDQRSRQRLFALEPDSQSLLTLANLPHLLPGREKPKRGGAAGRATPPQSAVSFAESSIWNIPYPLAPLVRVRANLSPKAKVGVSVWTREVVAMEGSIGEPPIER